MNEERDALQAKLDTIVRILGQDAASAREAYDEAREGVDRERVTETGATWREARAAYKTAKRIAER